MSSRGTKAAVACLHCRSRKRRCDGGRPQCRTCRLKRLECVYKQPVLRRDPSEEEQRQTPPQPESTQRVRSPSPVTPCSHHGGSGLDNPDRLATIERLLKDHTDLLVSLQAQSQRQPLFQTPAPPALNEIFTAEYYVSRTTPSGPVDQIHGQKFLLSQQQSASPFPWAWTRQPHPGKPTPPIHGDDHDDAPPITIPLGHQTSTSNLLMMPQCRALLGEYPEEFFFKVELNRPRAWAVRTMMASDLDNLTDHVQVSWVDGDRFLESYLKRVHPFHPFLSQGEVRHLYEDIMQKGIGIDNTSALVLAILALGATVSDAVDLKPELRTGEAFIQQALKILFASWTFTFSGDVTISQALSLCSLYFTYAVEPLMAWRLIHMASTSIQQLFSRCKNLLSSEPEVQTLTRLSWVCFIIESDILAEFHQPRSGIELLVDRMPFPNYGEIPSPENLYALADISARALLNRIHHALFFTDSLTIYSGHSLDDESSSRIPILNPDASHLRVCEELSRQLQAWYDSIPDVIKPDLDGNPIGSRQTCLLRLRYWSARRNIFRAFVIYVTSRNWEGEEVPQVVLEMCKVCLHACRMFIVMAQYLIKERSPYTYSATQCCLSSSIILAIAAQSPPLKGMIADIERIHEITMELLEPWAQAGTSIKSGYEIASLIAAKQRFR